MSFSYFGTLLNFRLQSWNISWNSWSYWIFTHFLDAHVVYIMWYFINSSTPVSGCVFSSPDAVPVRDEHHEGRLSGRRAEQTQPHADVQQRATGQEKHGHLISQTWRVHTVFISVFHFLQYTSFMSLLKMWSVRDRDSQSKRLWDVLMIKPVNKCSLLFVNLQGWFC